MVFLKRRMKKRSFLSLVTAREAAITARILSIIHELLEENIHATKREVFYNDVVLFKKQQESDEALEDVAAMLGVERNSLHVVASAKGAVVGKLRFREGGDLIDCSKMGTGGKAITPLVDTIDNIESDAEFILVVEKDAAFIRLAEDKFYERYPSIIVTGKGQPDIGTRKFLKLLVKELSLPVFSLVDSDPYGLHIMLVYAVGAKRTSYETQFLTIPDIKWLGVRPSDLDRFKIPKTVRIPMSDKDIERGKQLMQEEFIKKRPKYMEELQLMLRTKEKAEIQALASKGFRFLTKEYLPNKLETGDWI
jgi:meiotic recombination protein SPO11